MHSCWPFDFFLRFAQSGVAPAAAAPAAAAVASALQKNSERQLGGSKSASAVPIPEKDEEKTKVGAADPFS